MAVQADAAPGNITPAPKAPHKALNCFTATSVLDDTTPLKMLVCVLSMQSFGEHGRELITPEVGLRLLELLGQLGSDMEHTSAALTPQQKLLRRTIFKVSPCRTTAHHATTDCNILPHESLTPVTAYVPAVKSCELLQSEAFLYLTGSII